MYDTSESVGGTMGARVDIHSHRGETAKVR